MFSFAQPRPRRKPSLTPMIDVVFLLLVFFMLASQFGVDKALPLSAAGSGSGTYTGPPRLVDIGAPGDLRLNGVPVALDDLPGLLNPMMREPDDTIVLRGTDDATLQRLIDVARALEQAGFSRLSVVE